MDDQATYENIDGYKNNTSNVSINENSYPEDPIYRNLSEPVLVNPRKSPKNIARINIFQELEKKLESRNIGTTLYPERNTCNPEQYGQPKESFGKCSNFPEHLEGPKRANTLQRPSNFPQKLQQSTHTHRPQLGPHRLRELPPIPDNKNGLNSPNKSLPTSPKVIPNLEVLKLEDNIYGNISPISTSCGIVQKSPMFSQNDSYSPNGNNSGLEKQFLDIGKYKNTERYGNVKKITESLQKSPNFPVRSSIIPKIVLPNMETQTRNSKSPINFGKIPVLPLNLQHQSSSLQTSPEDNIYGNLNETNLEDEPIYGNVEKEDIASVNNKIKASDVDKNIIRGPNTGYIVDDFDSDEIINDDDDDDDFDDDEAYDYFLSQINVDVKDIPILELLTNPHFVNLKWSQIMIKLNIDIFGMSENEIQLQNAKFELLNAERSFEKSMNLLYSQFVQKLFIVLSKNEQNKLFAYIKEVKDCSQSFCVQLEKCWINNKFTEGFVEVICEFLDKKFDVYIHYAGNQIHSESLLGEILSDKTRKTFKELLDDIHMEQCSKGLHLHAYQLLPIRKVNNFPVLIENILKCLNSYHSEHNNCKIALKLSKQLLSRCNQIMKDAREHIRTKAIIEKLVFSKNTSLKLNINDNIHMRNLIKSDDLILIECTNTFYKKKISKTPVFAFLFNDIFVLARKTSANKYTVLDFCFRINLEIDRNPVLLGVVSSVNLDLILYLTMTENKDSKPTDFILCCKTKTDQIRWTEAIDPPDTSNANMKFDSDIIRKVIVQRNYSAVHSDEINLTIGEIYKILRETEDGWSFGQREFDGECGWFKSENIVLVDDVKERVKKVKEKYQSKRQ